MSEESLFEELYRRSEALREKPERDNEAQRHDLLVRPFLTSPQGLGWLDTELVSQNSIRLPKKITDPFVFRGAIPKKRVPDLLVSPEDLERTLLIVEEKAKQQDLADLNAHRLQLAEYQGLFECNWGILTDGDRWILKHGFETVVSFDSISELETGIRELQKHVGRECLRRDAKPRFVSVSSFTPVFDLKNLGDSVQFWQIATLQWGVGSVARRRCDHVGHLIVR